MPSDKNKQIVKDLREKIKVAKSITIADHRGLSAEDINSLRTQIKESDSEAVVAKNSLLRVALEEEGVDISELQKDLQGPTTAIFSYKDAVSPIKALFDFAKKLDLPKIKAAIIEGRYSNKSQVEEISKIPSKEELIARVVGGMKSPLSGVTRTLGGIQRNFVYVISAIKNAKSEGGAQE